MLGTFFKLVGKAFRFTVNRPLQRFNIESRAKKHLGEDAKYFMPAPRALGALSKDGPSQYPHLESNGFRSIRQRRAEALKNRKEQLASYSREESELKSKSFSETMRDDNFIIEATSKLPVIKTVSGLENPLIQQTTNSNKHQENKRHRPLPKKTSLPLQDPASIWEIDKTPPGRLNLNQLQEMMINHLSDEKYWTPEKISETYDIKKEYAENLLKYLKQVRIIISPRLKTALDYTARDNPVYQATKDIIYYVDKSLRNEVDKQYDSMYLPTDEIEDHIRELIDRGALEAEEKQKSLEAVFKRPEPLRLNPSNKLSSQDYKDIKQKKRLSAPIKVNDIDRTNDKDR